MGYYESYRPVKKKSSRRRPLVMVGIIILLAVSGATWFFMRGDATAPVAENTSQAAVETEVESTPPLPNLQSLVDDWAASHPGTYAVKIVDDQNNSLAEVNGDQSFFTASIYKLYVAYAGYQAIDDGTYSLNDPYLSGYTRGQCLDAMIRDSYSPCGEKMWAELGKANLTEKMKGYGLNNTSLTGLATSANDAAIILANIETSKDLKPASRQALLDSMKTQDSHYRRGLPSGFQSSTVYNKVGWNLSQEWHDTAIVELSNGRKVIISLFTEGAGYQNIAKLGTEIEKALQ